MKISPFYNEVIVNVRERFSKEIASEYRRRKRAAWKLLTVSRNHCEL